MARGAIDAWRVWPPLDHRIDREKEEDILLQDIGLRVWAETMAMKANRATQQAASDKTRGSEGFLVTHEVGNC